MKWLRGFATENLAPGPADTVNGVITRAWFAQRGKNKKRAALAALSTYKKVKNTMLFYFHKEPNFPFTVVSGSSPALFRFAMRYIFFDPLFIVTTPS